MEYIAKAESACEETRVEEQAMPIRLSDLFWVFMAGNVIGFFLEGLWSLLRLGEWQNHASFVWGPFCLIYGLGAVLMYLLAALVKKRAFPIRFLTFAVAGSALEYIASWVQEVVFGSASWSYEGHFLNLNGRISLRMTLIWGALGVLFASFVFPLFSKLLRKMHGRGWAVFCVLLALFMVVNLFMTATAVLRWGERVEGEEPSNSFEAFLDKAFGDERMVEVFSNLRFLE